MGIIYNQLKRERRFSSRWLLAVYSKSVSIGSMKNTFLKIKRRAVTPGDKLTTDLSALPVIEEIHLDLLALYADYHVSSLHIPHPIIILTSTERNRPLSAKANKKTARKADERYATEIRAEEVDH